MVERVVFLRRYFHKKLLELLRKYVYALNCAALQDRVFYGRVQDVYDLKE